jgi:hypothetical protein
LILDWDLPFACAANLPFAFYFVPFALYSPFNLYYLKAFFMRMLFIILLSTQVACNTSSTQTADFAQKVQGSWTIQDGTMDGKPAIHLLEGTTIQFTNKTLDGTLLEMLEMSPSMEYVLDGENVLSATDKTIVFSIKEATDTQLQILSKKEGNPLN